MADETTRNAEHEVKSWCNILNPCKEQMLHDIQELYSGYSEKKKLEVEETITQVCACQIPHAVQFLQKEGQDAFTRKDPESVKKHEAFLEYINQQVCRHVTKTFGRLVNSKEGLSGFFTNPKEDQEEKRVKEFLEPCVKTAVDGIHGKLLKYKTEDDLNEALSAARTYCTCSYPYAMKIIEESSPDGGITIAERDDIQGNPKKCSYPYAFLLNLAHLQNTRANAAAMKETESW
jgi:hypothetical protein